MEKQKRIEYLTPEAEVIELLSAKAFAASPLDNYHDDNPDNSPVVTWRAHANLLYSNWINYYVYQETPYNINDIK